MKIGIYTFFHTKDNYGQVLQAYALSAYLQKQGHETFIINRMRCKTGAPHKTLSSKLRVWISKHFTQAINNYFADRYCRLHPRDFDGFRAKTFQSAPLYETAEEIQSNPPAADAYICGSDQIWNTGCDNTSSISFLNFGKPETLRIAYAPSFGRLRRTPEFLVFLKEQLQRFTAVSVREKSGLAICQEAGFDEAVQVADPTFLLTKDDYQTLYPQTSDWQSPRRLFCYFLNFKLAKEIHWSEIKQFSQSGGYDIRVALSSGITRATENLGKTNYYSPNPDEWLHTLDECDYFITNSFHGVAFALIYHRPFLYMPFAGYTSYMNDRIVSLLDDLGLSSRVWQAGESIEAQIAKPIDWQDIDAKIAKMRDFSTSFLQQALNCKQ